MTTKKSSAVKIKQSKEAAVKKGTAGRQDHKRGAASSNKETGGKGAR